MPIVADIGTVTVEGRWQVDVGEAVITKKKESEIAWWGHTEGPWDKLQIGTFVLPGVWEISSGECARDIDTKKTKDKDGARIKDQGLVPAKFSATGTLVSHEEWVELQRILPQITPRRPGSLRTPFTIFHPAIVVLGVTTVYIERVRVPQVKSDMLEIGIDMIEWFETPKPAKTSKIVKAKGTSPEQFMANAMATPLEQTSPLLMGGMVHRVFEHGYAQDPDTPGQEASTGEATAEWLRAQETQRPSSSLQSEFAGARGAMHMRPEPIGPIQRPGDSGG